MGDEEFEAAAERVKVAGQRLSDDQKLKLYGLFKQAKEGSITTKRPAVWDFASRAKWDAWKAVEGMSQREAQEAYVRLAGTLLSGGGTEQQQEEEDEDWGEEEENGGDGDGGGGGISFGSRVSTMGMIGGTESADRGGDEGGEEEQETEDIFFFAKTGRVKEVHELLRRGGDGLIINETDEEGRTALHWATDAGQLDVVRLLVEAGADVGLKDADGETALDYAITCDHQVIAAFLVFFGEVTLQGILLNVPNAKYELALVEAVGRRGMERLHMTKRQGESVLGTPVHYDSLCQQLAPGVTVVRHVLLSQALTKDAFLLG